MAQCGRKIFNVIIEHERFCLKQRIIVGSKMDSQKDFIWFEHNMLFVTSLFRWLDDWHPPWNTLHCLCFLSSALYSISLSCERTIIVVDDENLNSILFCFTLLTASDLRNGTQCSDLHRNLFFYKCNYAQNKTRALPLLLTQTLCLFAHY